PYSFQFSFIKELKNYTKLSERAVFAPFIEIIVNALSVDFLFDKIFFQTKFPPERLISGVLQ
ncbi:hypothetical protein, partial [Elizabethkingia argenteiflava]|uniref:hypothetical protein n=1 Tax=Elizabethkingia argenteiflava TaxID=2681556 RepID=UPI001BB2F744